MTDTESTTARPALRADAQRNRVRILHAAESVFAESGPSASTEDVAARAGVAIGTVFRHFPTKRDLLAAIMAGLRCRFTTQARALAVHGDPATALFEFATDLVEQATTRRTVAALLEDTAGQVDSLHLAVETLLRRAQDAGAVRPDARITDVLALLGAAIHAAWDQRSRERTLGIIFDGLRSGARGYPG